MKLYRTYHPRHVHNLTEDEKAVIASLQKRTKAGEIIIKQSDKAKLTGLGKIKYVVVPVVVPDPFQDRLSLFIPVLCTYTDPG